jgi:hypothetical protein
MCSVFGGMTKVSWSYPDALDSFRQTSFKKDISNLCSIDGLEDEHCEPSGTGS